MGQQSYRQRLAAQQRQAEQRRFAAAIPPEILARMAPDQQAQVYATWRGQQDVVAATRRASARTRNTLLWVFIGVPAVLLVLFLVTRYLFY